jgi:hypothetical protein
MRKHVYGGAALGIEAGVISNYADVFAVQWCEALRLQHVEANHHLCGVTGMPRTLRVCSVRNVSLCGHSNAAQQRHQKKSHL